MEGAVPGEGPAVPPRYVDNRYLEICRYLSIYPPVADLDHLPHLRPHHLHLLLAPHRPGGSLGYCIIHYEHPNQYLLPGTYSPVAAAPIRMATQRPPARNILPCSRAASEAAALVPCYMWISHICDTGPFNNGINNVGRSLNE